MGPMARAATMQSARRDEEERRRWPVFRRRPLPVAGGRPRRRAAQLGAQPQRPNGRPVRRRGVRADAHRGARGARHRCPHPVRAPPRRIPVQLLARRRQPAWAVAADHAGQLPQRRHRLGRADRRRPAGSRRRRELGVVGRHRHRTRIRPRPGQSVPRRCRRGHRARIRHRHTRNSSTADSSCRRPRRRSAGTTTTPSWWAPTSGPTRSPSPATRASSSGGGAAHPSTRPSWSSKARAPTSASADRPIGHRVSSAPSSRDRPTSGTASATNCGARN